MNNDNKRLLIWWSFVLVMFVFTAAFVTVWTSNYNEHNIEKWQSCLQSGDNGLECKAAVYG